MRAHPFHLTLCVASVFLLNGTVLADKPSWAGKQGNKEERHAERREDRQDLAVAIRFNDDSRRIIGDYYGQQARAGHCPPGLAKKNNGCLPPGQAKKWMKGRPLPGDLRYRDLPRDLMMRLPPPPPHHRYVQVAGDILLIAVGSSMVIDAVEDILR